MFCLPANSPRTASIIGIDPGSETLGVAVLKFDVETMEIVSTTAQTYTGSRMYSANNWQSETHGDRCARINAHKENLTNIFFHEEPIQICCESSFYNRLRPNAYGVLIEVLDAVRQAVIAYDVWRKLYLVDPPTVKKSVGAPGNADKFVVKAAVMRLPDLRYQGQFGLDVVDEHSIDAMAVAYCRFQELKKSNF